MWEISDLSFLFDTGKSVNPDFPTKCYTLENINFIELIDLVIYGYKASTSGYIAVHFCLGFAKGTHFTLKYIQTQKLRSRKYNQIESPR